MTGQHEIFHLFDCVAYYENNCSASIKSPRKRNYDAEDKDYEVGDMLNFFYMMMFGINKFKKNTLYIK